MGKFDAWRDLRDIWLRQMQSGLRGELGPDEDVLEAVGDDIDTIHGLVNALTQQQIGMMVERFLESADDSHGAKSALAANINDLCRKRGLAIEHPDTKEPCKVILNHDGHKLYFMLEVLGSRKRSKSTPFIEQLPLDRTRLLRDLTDA